MAKLGKESVELVLVIRMLKFFADQLDCHIKMQFGEIQILLVANTIFNTINLILIT